MPTFGRDVPRSASSPPSCHTVGVAGQLAGCVADALLLYAGSANAGARPLARAACRAARPCTHPVRPCAAYLCSPVLRDEHWRPARSSCTADTLQLFVLFFSPQACGTLRGRHAGGRRGRAAAAGAAARAADRRGGAGRAGRAGGPAPGHLPRVVRRRGCGGGGRVPARGGAPGRPWRAGAGPRPAGRRQGGCASAAAGRRAAMRGPGGAGAGARDSGRVLLRGLFRVPFGVLSRARAGGGADGAGAGAGAHGSGRFLIRVFSRYHSGFQPRRTQVVELTVPELELARVAHVVTIGSEMALAHRPATAVPALRRQCGPLPCFTTGQEAPCFTSAQAQLHVRTACFSRARAIALPGLAPLTRTDAQTGHPGPRPGCASIAVDACCPDVWGART